MADDFEEEEEENYLSKPDIEESEFCPLCNIKTKTLTCESCVRIGDFLHSRGKYSERYYEKLEKVIDLKKKRLLFQERVLQAIRRREGVENLNKDVILCQERVQILSNVVKEETERLREDCKVLQSLKEANSTALSRLKGSKDKVQKFATQRDQLQVQLCRTKTELSKVNKELCHTRQRSVNRIQKYLFPIQSHQVYPVMGTPPIQDPRELMKDIECDTDSKQDVESFESALADATRTSYIEGQWVSEEEEIVLEYSIIDACLPSNGDYSMYTDWVKEFHRNGSEGPDEELGTRNPAFSITASLTHTAQLVELLVFYLDVNLPKKLSYSEICHHELNRKEFRNIVNRLNANVMHLCFTQHVEPSRLGSKWLLHNLFTCISSNNVNLGRGGPFECYPELISTYEYTSDNERDNFVSDDERNSESDADWETLPDTLNFDVSAENLPERTSSRDSLARSRSPDAEQKTMESSATTSLVSSAAASVAALWPWKK